MRIAFVVNDVDTEVHQATSTLLALTAHRRGHEVYVCGVGELTCRPDNHVVGAARVPVGKPRKAQTFLATLQGPAVRRAEFSTASLDVLWLRYNPSEAVGEEAWARHAGFHFGQLAVRQGVLVLNHPFTLPYAMNKTYLQHFPEEVRPRALITRSTEEIRRFYEECGQHMVLKPLEGYGGADVFSADHDASNLNQMIDAVRRSGYVLAQEYVAGAEEGDTRLFLMNGRPLQVDGRYAAVRRVPGSGDFRANFSAGASVGRARVDARMLKLAEAFHPKLVEDGIFLAGLDVLGDRVVELNTISTGALRACSILEDVDFAAAVIAAIERKVEHRRRYEGRLSNRKLATME
jgi:glutathione synthase